MKEPTLRVYFVTHSNGHLTGILMRLWSDSWDPPPSAYGATEADVYNQLERQLLQLEATQPGHLERFLWRESFNTRTVVVPVHPYSTVRKQPVVGAREVPLKLSYAWSRLRSDADASQKRKKQRADEVTAFRVMLPRFGWWVILEDLETAPEVLRSAVSSAFLGENPRWIYEFRYEGPEYVREWKPAFLDRHRPRPHGGDESVEAPPALQQVAEEWVDKARRKRLPSVVGAPEDDLDRFLQISARGHRPSVLLVGEPGVGKSAWVRRLAHHFAARGKGKKRQRVPQIWATSADRIIAGMVYLGMWQQRCLDLVQEVSSARAYLYADHLAGILKEQPGGSSIIDLFRPALEAGELPLIVECTNEELEHVQWKAPSLVALFEVIRIWAPSPSDVPAVMQQYQQQKSKLVSIHPEGLKRAVEHLDRYNRATAFPGKAFQFLDWLNTDLDTSAARTIYADAVSQAYSRFSGLPVELISDEFTVGSSHIAGQLTQAVIGQDRACETAARVLARLKAGMNDPDRPCGSLFFVGPTGVGKTELAKQLARYMFGDAKRMVRLDMSEYMYGGSAQRLLSVGAGVRSLAQQISEQPLSLVLLDEIEKAHPEVFDLLLGVLGEGRLTDERGRFVDFRMTVIVMTSNIGTKSGATPGFGDRTDESFSREVRKYFRPEFFNRLDYVVTFDRLGPDSLLHIVDLEIAKAARRTGLARRRLLLRVDEEAKAELARLGYDEQFGARPLRRVIEERVVAPLAVVLAADPSRTDEVVSVVRRGSPAEEALSKSQRHNAILV